MIALLLLFVASDAPAKGAPPVENAWSVLDYGVVDNSADRRSQAVHALAILEGNVHAGKLAEHALKDSNADVRAEAANTLGRMHATSAVPLLKQALNDHEVNVVLSAAGALYELKDPAAYDVYYAVLTGQQKSTQGLLASQLAMLKSRKEMERLAIETGIGFIPFGSLGYQAWKTITRDNSSLVKAAAALRLASDPDSKSGQALAAACKDDSWQVRAAAAQAIAKRGDTTLMHNLTPLLNDPTDAVRYESAASLIWLSQHPRKPRGLRH
ncbi:MAG TPA: HEAT repeat domain-containing protein [Bryobacteraceae bacterium]|jgi:HEAT repeat protein